MSLAASHAQAAWPSDPTLNLPVCTATLDQYPTQSIPDGSGGVIVIWSDLRNGTDSNIYAQRINASGTAVWTAGGVAICTSAFNQPVASAVSDGAGGAIITWESSSLYIGETDIYAQRVNAAGVVQWAAAGVPICTNAGPQAGPMIASDGAGGAIMTWSDWSSTNIFAQRLNASGTALWVTNGVPICTDPGSQHSPSIVSDGSGGAILAWVDQRGGTSLYAQRVNSAGVAQWAADGVPVCGGPVHSFGAPPMITDGAGGMITSWSAGPSVLDHDVYAQRISSSGAQQWGVGVTVCAAANQQALSVITTDGAGGAILAWQDGRGSYPTIQIAAQRVSFAGVTQWTADGVVLRTIGNNGSPSIATDGAGGAIVSWTGNLPGIDFGWNVHAQRGNNAGTTLWAADGVPVSTAAGDQDVQTNLVADGSGGAIAVWRDRRSGSNYDVYAQRIDGAGTLGGGPTETFGGIAGQVTAECPVSGTPLPGITVDAFEVGSGDLIGTAVTDAGGNFAIPQIPTSDYMVTLVMPLGYGTTAAELGVTVLEGQTSTANFALVCTSASGSPHGSGFWKHQFGVATGGSGSAQIGGTTLCTYLDAIALHFNNNSLNQVVVYDPPVGSTCAQKLEIAKGLLNLGGSSAPVDKARQQLLSLLLNVAANNLTLNDVVSKDGATASQAVTYCDQVIDNPSGNYLLAASIADKINSGQKVNAGVIPLGTQNIAYALGGRLLEFSAGRNPTSGPRTFTFALSAPAKVDLSIYDVQGRRVARVYTGQLGEGRHALPWNGTTTRGERLGRGVYFSRLTAGEQTRVSKLVQTAP